MEKNAEGDAETRVAKGSHGGSAVETRKEWITPELRKMDIEEITANGGALSADGIMSS